MADDREWPADDPDTFEGECEWCGGHHPLQKRADPFVCEGIIDGDPDEEEAVCRSCYYRRLDDV